MIFLFCLEFNLFNLSENAENAKNAAENAKNAAKSVESAESAESAENAAKSAVKSAESAKSAENTAKISEIFAFSLIILRKAELFLDIKKPPIIIRKKIIRKITTDNIKFPISKSYSLKNRLVCTIK